MRIRFSTALHPFLRFVLYLAGVQLFVFYVLRLVLLFFLKENGQRVNVEVLRLVSVYAWPFDAFVTTYVCALPSLVLVAMLWVDKEKVKSVFGKILGVYAAIFIPCVLFTTIADMPYFLFFQNRLTEATFQWFDNTALVFEMLVSNTWYLVLLIVAVIICFAAGWMVFKMSKRVFSPSQINLRYHWSINLILSVAVLLVTFIGMRGRLDHPLREGDAFFCENTTINQACLNPIFTLVKSYEAKANLMPDELAVSETKQILSIANTIDSISPFARFVPTSTQAAAKPNVVLVLMESMSADYLGAFGNTQALTPNLDSLATLSWLHTNMYSSGIHTNNGVFSTLYGFPAIKRTRPMSTVPLRIYHGIPQTLKMNGYSTLFFTTHNKTFDNLGAFIPANGFDKLYSVEDYEKSAELGPFGVPDDYLFSFAAQKLGQQQHPFFATILTTSNHEPYMIPDKHQHKKGNKSLDAVHYADWSIGQFMQQCSKQPWYKNTLFLFIADHGLNVGKQVSGFALNYHHIPLIVHQPGKAEHKKIDGFIQQLDVYPYLMSLLNVAHINNTLGVAPAQMQRDMVYFSADDKLVTLSKEWLYIYYYSGKEFLFKRNEEQSKNYVNEEPTVKENMKRYAFAQTQSAEYVFRTDKTAIK